MGSGRGLAAAAFEIHHGDDLQPFAAAAVRQIAAVTPRPLVELFADFMDVFDRVAAPRPFGSGGRLPVRAQLAQVTFGDTQKLGRFDRAERSDGLLGLWRKNCTMMRLELRRQFLAVLLDDRLQFRWAIHSGRNLRHSSNIPLKPKLRVFPHLAQKSAVTGFLRFQGAGKSYWVNKVLRPNGVR